VKTASTPGVDRAHDHRVRLARQVDVVVKPPLAAQEADVLEPLDGLADPELPHPPRLPVCECRVVVTHFGAVWSSPEATSLQSLRKILHLP